MILTNKSHQELYDKPYSLQCPHCNNSSGITLISVPQYDYIERFRPRNIGMVFKCDVCNEPIFLKFEIERFDLGNYKIHIKEEFEIVEYPKISFEFEYIPEPVRSDFMEALDCISIGAYNAFASMCRRTIQSVAESLGAKGSSKVQKQVNDLKEMEIVDEEAIEIIKQIILDGHDGSHPHLPTLSRERADVLLELMKDIIYQLFIRKGKLQKASELRKKEIEKKD